ncbi:NYN domain-containing protein [Pseudogemmobacter sp. W21_MBD1_M6]|uniref:NYN domain-containing protein n=1 Tax=Pseudogemmobacter sp. W21_MBD1_M6 TaxID=3240271 RepID=UPI003F9C6B3B
MLLIPILGVAALIILIRRVLRPKAAVPPRGRRIVVDGSNVMHWRAEAPSLDVLHRVLAELVKAEFVPVVFFDANVGYKLSGRHMDAAELATLLGISPAQVQISPSGTPADPMLLDYASRNGLRVVSNDRFRDWRVKFRKVGTKGFLIRGRYAEGRVDMPMLHEIVRKRGLVG